MLKPGAPKMAKLKGGGRAATGKSKVISTGTLNGVKGGSTKMSGKQSVKAAKAR